MSSRVYSSDEVEKIRAHYNQEIQDIKLDYQSRLLAKDREWDKKVRKLAHVPTTILQRDKIDHNITEHAPPRFPGACFLCFFIHIPFQHTSCVIPLCRSYHTFFSRSTQFTVRMMIFISETL